MANSLIHGFTSLRRSDLAALEKFLLGPRKSLVAWWVNAIRQVDANGSDRGLISNAIPNGMHHVVEISRASLLDTERHAACCCKDVPHVVKNHSADVLA